MAECRFVLDAYVCEFMWKNCPIVEFQATKPLNTNEQSMKKDILNINTLFCANEYVLLLAHDTENKRISDLVHKQ